MKPVFIKPDLKQDLELIKAFKGFRSINQVIELIGRENIDVLINDFKGVNNEVKKDVEGILN